MTLPTKISQLINEHSLIFKVSLSLSLSGNSVITKLKISLWFIIITVGFISSLCPLITFVYAL